jgi:hypothetical protein
MTLKSLIGIAAVAGVAGFLGGVFGSQNRVQAASPQTIRASRFELINAAGATLAIWETGSGNEAHLRFLPARGHAAVDVGVQPDGSPVIQMAGRDGKRRIVLALDQFDRPALGMGDERWEGRVVLGFKGSDVPDRAEDDWGLSFMAFGSERPVAALGVVKANSSSPEGILTLSGKRIQ